MTSVSARERYTVRCEDTVRPNGSPKISRKPSLQRGVILAQLLLEERLGAL